MKTLTRELWQSAKVLALALFLSLGVSYAFAWTGPTAAPPGSNAPTPLNTGDTVQTKSGGLNVSGNVGIGTVSPSTKFDITATWGAAGSPPTQATLHSADIAGISFVAGGYPNANPWMLYAYNSADGKFCMGKNGVNEPFCIGGSGGDFGFNHAPVNWGGGNGAYTTIAFGDDESLCGYKVIHANSNVIGFHGGCGDGWLSYWSQGGSQYTPGSISAGAFYYNSDASLKKDVKTIPNALDKILQLRGVEFNWKKDNSPSVGVIAQEVEKVFPELVTSYPVDPAKPNGVKLKTVEYGNLVAPLIEAVRELKAENDALRARIEKLEARH